ncbi:PGN_0703 family putative restriction endonuclease [Faunimonas sp. B44]|uniref:PGN_0703 family putative restriction endonuclease n=1 Tax=Faunimonas sp. B44 TaxID=3461493 RepID=UPI004043ED32
MMFEKRERRRLKEAWENEFAPADVLPSGLQLQRERASANLAPLIRAQAVDYFRLHNVTWHTHANHALSSQVACLNFLMPLASRPVLLAKIIGRALDMPPPNMLPVETAPDGNPSYVGFEWTGRQDHLSEWRNGVVNRGQNATSADAVVRFENKSGDPETILIEWKYTEHYSRKPTGDAGNPTRIARYTDKAFAPNGPIRNDLGLKLEDFFYEPFYQLLRQQMLAWRMQRAQEDGATRVRVLHISPAGNLALHRVTAPALARFGTDAFAVFRHVLQEPDEFISRTTEAVFARLLSEPELDEHTQAWVHYLWKRYDFMAGAAE